MMGSGPLDLLRKYELKPRRGLSQSFLVNAGVARKIVAAAEIGPNDTVIEIGPGLGILTRLMAPQARRLIAIELDERLCTILRRELAPLFPNLSLIQADVTTFDFSRLDLGPVAAAKVVANIPYHVTTPVLETLIAHRMLFSRALLTVQAEVARRIVAGPGGKDYGALSVYLQYHTIPSILFSISPGSFFPVPRVMSAFLSLEFRREPPVHVKDAAFFFRVVRASFARRRKMLRSALAAMLPVDLATLVALSSSSGIDPTRRGETLNLEEFARLSDALLACTDRNGRLP
jgi:16S rRNA (adenine1518-N6/adenine1519-N6)-dimethyltransferase